MSQTIQKLFDTKNIPQDALKLLEKFRQDNPRHNPGEFEAGKRASKANPRLEPPDDRRARKAQTRLHERKERARRLCAIFYVVEFGAADAAFFKP